MLQYFTIFISFFTSWLQFILLSGDGGGCECGRLVGADKPSLTSQTLLAGQICGEDNVHWASLSLSLSLSLSHSHSLTHTHTHTHTHTNNRLYHKSHQHRIYTKTTLQFRDRQCVQCKCYSKIWQFANIKVSPNVPLS